MFSDSTWGILSCFMRGKRIRETEIYSYRRNKMYRVRGKPDIAVTYWVMLSES